MSLKINPWQLEGSPWDTEAKFITWIRGVLRRGWGVHPLKIIYKDSKKIKVKNTNPRSMKAHPEVFKIKCEKCNNLFSPNDIEIDHKGDFHGKFTSLSEIEAYARHLFMIDYDSIQAVCKSCHKTISQSQKSGVSFEEAAIQKAIIAKGKLPVKEQLDELQQRGYNGCTNAKKRKEAWTDYFNKE